MGYLHIPNLYQDNRIFAFAECWAEEKIHGTSAHISFKQTPEGPVATFFSGGEKYDNFVALFDQPFLLEVFKRTEVQNLTLYGEAYGGKQQGMRATYGDQLKFVVFDVMVEGRWLDVTHAYVMTRMFELEFVDFAKISTKLSDIDAERAKPSTQARRNGIMEPKEREGIVLRPLHESYDKRGNRIITKHKNDSFKETKTKREVDPQRRQRLSEATAIAEEWVTDMRLDHVMDKILGLKIDAEKEFRQGCYEDARVELQIEDTGIVVKAMIEDIRREAQGEILESKDATRAIGAAAANLFKRRLYSRTSQKENANG